MEVRALEVEQRERDNVLMIAPGDVSMIPVSCVVNLYMKIHIMIYPQDLFLSEAVPILTNSYGC